MPISTPSQITVPFATSGLKNAIPSTSNPVTGNAGYDAGFPATNMTPKEAGGIPPFGQDFNGILFDITTAIRYLEAGMQFPYSSTFATAVGGYPLGAIVTRTDGTGFWRNTVANNMTDPETFGAGWSPEGSGISTVAMSNANVTLTALQSARPIIIITGALTASLNLIFPTYQRQWLVVNNATGAFSVTCKTSSGSGISIATGISQSIYGDGTNIGSASATQTQQSSVGSFSNLRSSATGLSAIVTITADEVVLEAASGNYLTARSVSITTLSLAGSGANGLDTGTSTGSTWYSVWIISNGTTTSGLLSLSATAPTMPSGFTFKARIGWVRSDATVNKFPFSYIQRGRSFQYVVVSGSNLASPRQIAVGVAGNPTSNSWAAIDTSAYVPTTAARILGAASSSNGGGITVAPNNNYVTNIPALTDTGSPLAMAGQATTFLISQGFNFILESTNIYWASNLAIARVWCIGWEDNL
jgi:hypothetical protein